MTEKLTKKQISELERYLLAMEVYKPGSSHYKRLQKELGEDGIEWMYQLLQDKHYQRISVTQFYEKKMEDSNINSLIISMFDYDWYMSVFEWLIQNKDRFGSTVLEIGCETGIITCFLAKLLPESKIIAIDHSLRNAQATADKVSQLGLNNVTVKCVDLKDVDEAYDTVLSLRIAHENIIGDPDENSMFDYREQAEEFEKGLKSYALKLAQIARGNLISVERFGADPGYLGWLLALNEAGLILEKGSDKEICCQEATKLSCFQASIFCHDGTHEVDWLQKLVEEKGRPTKGKEGAYWGWAALSRFNSLSVELIKGYEVVKDGNVCGRYCLWQNKKKKYEILITSRNEDSFYYMQFKKQQEPILLQDIWAVVSNQAAEVSGKVVEIKASNS